MRQPKVYCLIYFVQLRIAKVKRLHKPWTSSTSCQRSVIRYQVQEQGDPRLRQRLGIKPEEVLVTRFCQPEGGGGIQLLPGCRD